MSTIVLYICLCILGLPWRQVWRYQWVMRAMNRRTENTMAKMKMPKMSHKNAVLLIPEQWNQRLRWHTVNSEAILVGLSNHVFYAMGRENADGGLYWHWFLRTVLDASKECTCTTLFARWFQWITVSTKKNVGTAVSCCLVIKVLLFYCMYVSLLYLLLYNLQNVLLWCYFLV